MNEYNSKKVSGLIFLTLIISIPVEILRNKYITSVNVTSSIDQLFMTSLLYFLNCIPLALIAYFLRKRKKLAEYFLLFFCTVDIFYIGSYYDLFEKNMLLGILNLAIKVILFYALFLVFESTIKSFFGTNPKKDLLSNK